MTPSISEAEFAVLADQTGLPLSDQERSALYQAYAHIETMIARVNAGERPRAVEPSIIFVPGQP